MKLRDRIFIYLYGIGGVYSLLPPRNIRTIHFTHGVSLAYALFFTILVGIEYVNYGFSCFFFGGLLVICLLSLNFAFFIRHFSIRHYRCPLYAIVTLAALICAFLSQNQIYVFLVAAPLPVVLISEKSVKRQIVWLSLFPIIMALLFFVDHFLSLSIITNSLYLMVAGSAFAFSGLTAVFYRFSISRTFWGTLASYTRNEILDIQLELAETIQRMLIPDKSIILDSYEVAFHYQPAYGIGGDYLDIIEMSDSHVGLVMCDVAGKGIPAALMMTSVRTLTRALIARGIENPIEIISILNDSFRSDFGDEFYVTFAFIHYNTIGKSIEFYNAGHTPFIYYSCIEKRIKEIELDGYPIGIFDTVYQDAKITQQLFSGDIVVLFSDGLTDFINSNDHTASRTQLFIEIQRRAHLTAEQIKNEIIEMFITDKVSNTVDDDISLMIFKVH